MNQPKPIFNNSNILISLAALVVIVAGMKAAADLLVPLLLSIFIAFLFTPFLHGCTRRGVPTGVALLLVVVLIMTLGWLTGLALGSSFKDFSESLPLYENRLQQVTANTLIWLEGMGIPISLEHLLEFANPAAALKLSGKLLNSLSNLLTDAFIILLTTIFILAEATQFPQKLKSLLKNPDETLARFSTLRETINRYLALKTATSFVTAALVSLILSILGVDFPLLWGLLAFMLNFVPTVGSIIAAVPAILLALVQLGPLTAFWTLLGYLFINIFIGNIIEPRIMGRGLGLSAFVILASLVFWGWVLGPVGMFLSVPLTMLAKLASENSEQTRWVGTLLSANISDTEDPER
jgi:predicted PurR-regulated permease PerM